MHDNTILLHQTPITIRFAGSHVAAQGEDYPLHFHDGWELVYVRTGHIECRQRNDTHLLHAGMAILHPPRVSHADIASTGYTNYHVCFDAPLDLPWMRLFVDDDTRNLETLCGEIVREWHGREIERGAMLQALMTQLTIYLNRNSTARQNRVPDKLVADAEHLIEEYYNVSITVGQMARALGASPSSLHANFVRLRGKTPMDHLRAVRLRHALTMLYHSNLKLEVIAAQCGYDSPSHLSRHIKNATGESPGRLRTLALTDKQERQIDDGSPAGRQE